MAETSADRVAHLLELLDLEALDDDLFRGQNERGREVRLFGGQVMAQALVAASRTVGGRAPHSLHGYFLRPGDPARPVIYSVDRIRDGRSFATRRVVAQQRGRAIFNMAVSYHADEEGYEHQLPMPAAPEPESLPTWSELVERHWDDIAPEVRRWAPLPRPIDLRPVERPTFFGGGGDGQIRQLTWLRIPVPLPDDPSIHYYTLTYASDMSLIDTCVRPHGRDGPRGAFMIASLDHALWFHRPFRTDDWLLYVQDSPASAGARGFARGTLFTRAGELVASVAQEGLMRPTGQPEDRTQ